MIWLESKYDQQLGRAGGQRLRRSSPSCSHWRRCCRDSRS
jgi:hypothetical protein